ncbi:stage III sporulation protein AF [Cellulosilyticum sp. I15G10I2]|uniref:stage III sporulation protein AF n=1 Tax=Cellulosilyticum sp. I15G10I2 TaxID=1892843 RepID=UPI00085BDC2C|nr:stage III sporulation protein AF [Cellulosilyticum sp. I15G10I2]
MREYMQMFIWIMLFVIVIEMIFPDSDYKKYLKLVLGCIIIYTIIQPIVQFIPVQGKGYDTYVSEYQKRLSEGINYNDSVQGYDEQVKSQQSLLKETLKSSIKGIIEKEIDVSVQRVHIEWHDEGGEEQIEEIHIVVGESENNNTKNVILPKIRIGDKSQSLSGDTEKLKIKIKTCLQNFYNVPSRNIYITVQKN